MRFPTSPGRTGHGTLATPGPSSSAPSASTTRPGYWAQGPASSTDAATIGWTGRTEKIYDAQRMPLDRNRELNDSDRQLQAVRGGVGRVIVIEGPAGIGKTSLLAVVARAAEACGDTVLQAGGGPLEQDAAWAIA